VVWRQDKRMLGDIIENKALRKDREL